MNINKIKSLSLITFFIIFLFFVSNLSIAFNWPKCYDCCTRDETTYAGECYLLSDPDPPTIACYQVTAGDPCSESTTIDSAYKWLEVVCDEIIIKDDCILEKRY